jgi:drug/metabolite transporter (DMT)-like permease
LPPLRGDHNLPSMSELAQRRGALLALGVLTLVWSYNWVVMKQVLAFVGPFHFAAMRAVLATAVLFSVVALRGESLAPPPLLPTLGIGLTQTLGFQALVQWALVDGGAGRTALLAYTMPFWVLLLAWFALKETPTRQQWLSIGLAAVGLLLIIEPWHGFANAHSAMLALISGLVWASSVVLSKRLFARASVSPLRLTTWQMAFGALALVLLALAVPEKATQWTPAFLAGLAYNAVFASGLAWVMWALVVQRLPTMVAGLTSLVVPLSSTLLAWAILGERPSLVEATGIALIAAALLGVTIRRRASDEEGEKK